MTLGAYFDSKKDLNDWKVDWKVKGDEVFDNNLTPTKSNSVGPTKIGKLLSKKKQVMSTNKIVGRRLLDMNEMTAENLITDNEGKDAIYLGSASTSPAHKSPK